MICARCDKPIRPGEAYTTEAIAGASAGGSDVNLHTYCVRPPAVARPRTYPKQDQRHY